MNVIKEIKRFQKDRLLHKQEFNYDNESVNILEEMFEMYGYNVPKNEREFLKLEWMNFMRRQIEAGTVETAKITDEEECIDALGDIIVFAVGAIMKLGYDPECVLEQVATEINSRSGEIVDGKFQKNQSDEAKAKWYKAQFGPCRVDYP